MIIMGYAVNIFGYKKLAVRQTQTKQQLNSNSLSYQWLHRSKCNKQKIPSQVTKKTISNYTQ